MIDPSSDDRVAQLAARSRRSAGYVARARGSDRGFGSVAGASGVAHAGPSGAMGRCDAAARVWQGLRAGANPRCTSPSGVVDLAGSVDEWTRSDARVDAGERRWASVLKGGYRAEPLNRCRNSTRAHDEDFAFYPIGFRCCRSQP